MGDEVKPAGTCMGGSSSLGSRVTFVVTFLIQASPLPVTGEVPIGHVCVSNSIIVSDVTSDSTDFKPQKKRKRQDVKKVSDKHLNTMYYEIILIIMEYFRLAFHQVPSKLMWVYMYMYIYNV